MKKLITIFCFACISVCTVVAQKGVKIGNMEIVIKKIDQDTVTQIIVEDPCPPCPSEKETRPKPKASKYHRSSFFAGIGFILPDYGSDYYTVLGGNSINIDAGWLHRFQITRRFSLGGTLQYSYYNYKLRDAASDPVFAGEVIGGPVDPGDIDKQVYRCHDIATSAFTRFYLVPASTWSNSSGLYLDLGIQGDFAFSKYYKLNTNSGGNKKHHDDYAFNPFTASTIVRVGWNWFSVFARYRFTDAFNSRALPMDLPPITIGIQIL